MAESAFTIPLHTLTRETLMDLIINGRTVSIDADPEMPLL